MRKAAPVFHAAQEQSVAIGQQDGAGVEDTVDGIGPQLPAKDGVIGVARKEKALCGGFLMGLFLRDRL